MASGFVRTREIVCPSLISASSEKEAKSGVPANMILNLILLKRIIVTEI